MALLLANPITRSRVVLEKAAVMTVYAVVVGVATFAGIAGGSLLGNLGIDVGNIAAASTLVTLLGLAFGALSLLLSAATGRVGLAVYGTVGAAITAHLTNALLSVSDQLVGYARVSPFYYYLTGDPLSTGMNWSYAAVLAALVVVLIAASVPLFERRDLRAG